MAARTALTTTCRSVCSCSVPSRFFNAAFTSSITRKSPKRRGQRVCALALPSARPYSSSRRVPDFGFVFDIDGVLLRSSDPIPGAAKSLRRLKEQRVPFILLTNGGGRHERERIAELNERLGVELEQSQLVQSHTPFEHLNGFKDKTVLVVGGDGDNCRKVALSYGYNNVVTPADIWMAHPEIWPFSKNFIDYYRTCHKPLPQRINPQNPQDSLKIDAIFVYNDPRDWGLDAAIILDALLSSKGILGTLSVKNDSPDLPNRGYQQDGQPPLYFSNPDLWWAAQFPLPRLGQGGFREAMEGLWAAVTGGHRMGVELQKHVMGKPFQPTYAYAEKQLVAERQRLLQGTEDEVPLRRVYMVGDNPESDIRGGNTYKSAIGAEWKTALVRTGVYTQGTPMWEPDAIADNVEMVIQWAFEDSRWVKIEEMGQL